MKPRNRYYLSHAAFRFLRWHLQRKEIYFIAGTNSLFVPSRQEKYILANRPDGSPVCKEWPDENGDVYRQTPSEAARSELKRHFPGLRRTGFQPQHISLFDWRWPMLFSGSRNFDGHYIDLKGAYWQLYRRLWLDVAFPCGYGRLALQHVAERLTEWKAARNALIGCTAARTTLGVKGLKSYHLSTNNPFLAPHLWATIQAILNELALRAEELGAVYIATDGYIFPNQSRWLEFEELLLDFGLLYRKVSGPADIRAWGAYRVGKHMTESYLRSEIPIFNQFRAIRVVDTHQPLKMLGWWGNSIPRYNNLIWATKGAENA